MRSVGDRGGGWGGAEERSYNNSSQIPLDTHTRTHSHTTNLPLKIIIFPMRRQQTLLESAKRYKSGRGLHYQSLRFCLQSLNFLHRGELKKKKGKEGREDKGGAACCISIPPAERLSVCLWQQPREGDTLCILTQLVYLSLCHCLSLALSVSACLSLAMSVCYISASTLPLPVTVFLHSGQFFFSPQSSRISLSLCLTLSSLCLSGLPPQIFYIGPPPLPSPPHLIFI